MIPGNKLTLEQENYLIQIIPNIYYEGNQFKQLEENKKIQLLQQRNITHVIAFQTDSLEFYDKNKIKYLSMNGIEEEFQALKVLYKHLQKLNQNQVLLIEQSQSDGQVVNILYSLLEFKELTPEESSQIIQNVEFKLKKNLKKSQITESQDEFQSVKSEILEESQEFESLVQSEIFQNQSEYFSDFGRNSVTSHYMLRGINQVRSEYGSSILPGEINDSQYQPDSQKQNSILISEKDGNRNDLSSIDETQSIRVESIFKKSYNTLRSMCEIYSEMQDDKTSTINRSLVCNIRNNQVSKKY